ncbi:Vacuolar protein-sorting-associated protein 33 [Saxophila tyrrhenica]|uniref:Vacuolar protein-sorting-associated protein 33 n=1 Tax=Saxophila tyrrhenica TaxID=1690608 RepID=A0AAV9PJ60_9PEZI|nr:Vacuolar protein-sorting-associated protein 33 [Saxophila tyrrhenica]
MAAHPAVKAINTQEITEKARRGLLQLLEAVRGKKNLVIERSLAGTIGLFVKFSTLQEYGVDKIFFLENHNVDSSQRNIIFLCRGESAKTARMVAEQIKLVRSESQIDHEFSIIWVPRRTRVSDMVLEEHGTLGEATISQLQLHFIPLEQDVLSLELDTAVHDLYLRKDPTCIFASAQALMRLQKQYGLFPRILGKGDNAKKLADLLQKMRSEEEVNAAADSNNSYLTSFGLTPSSVIENLIIIDRDVDFPTVLSTQLTYEGLIDENYGITNNQTEVESSILGGAPAQPQSQNGTTQAPATATKRKLQLDTSDKLYPSLRDANFATIGPTLNRTARRLQSDQQNIHNQDQSIADLKSFVSKLPSYQAEQASLKIHTSLAEELMKVTRSELFNQMLEVQQNLLAGSDPSATHENIEELIARDVPFKTVLRLLCLESCLSNGIRSRDLENFKRQILQAYGFQHVLTLANLEKMGLLVPRESHRGYLNPIGSAAGQTATDWNALRKGLKLWVDDVQEDDPNDVAYVFSGFAPLSVRLVQCILQKSQLYNLVNQPRQPSSAPTGTGWKGFEDVVARIRGATVDVTQKGHDADASHARKTLRGSKEGPKISLVFFLGGVTFAEIAALRLVSAQMEEKEGRKIVIMTTGLVNGGRAVGTAVEKREFGQ